MKISIIGLGWFGSPLALELKADGHEVSGSSTSEEKINAFLQKDVYAFRLKYPEMPKAIDADILILNIPPFPEELEWFKSWEISPETWVIFISSTSVESKTNETLSSQEEWVKTLPHWTILRFGGLFGGERHPGKYLSGKKNLPGRLWPVNMLHLNDAIGFTKKIIELKTKSKIFTVLSSDHPTREEFYTSFCMKNNLPLPEFDQDDVSLKSPLSNEEAQKLFSFMKLK
jgi:nucleoside-diphosphate-sugar epimerase